mgnify:CR=1 FL=1
MTTETKTEALTTDLRKTLEEGVPARASLKAFSKEMLALFEVHMKRPDGIEFDDVKVAKRILAKAIDDIADEFNVSWDS